MRVSQSCGGRTRRTLIPIRFIGGTDQAGAAGGERVECAGAIPEGR